MEVNGRQLADTYAGDLAGFFSDLSQKASLHIVFVGDDPVIENFIHFKRKVAERVGVETVVHRFDAAITTEELVIHVQSIVTALTPFDGMIIQLPLPSHIDEGTILDLVPANRDIDVLASETYQAFQDSATDLVPPVARSVQCVLQNQKSDLAGKEIVVVGQGRLVGKPVADLFQREGFRVTTVDEHTDKVDIQKLLADADLIVTGAGDSWFITPDMVQEGVMLVDAGTSESGNTVKGDIHPDCYEKAAWHTPVPGGIGPLTIVMLLENLRILIQERM